MAVLVQQQIDADAAGVAFTADPVTGARDMTVINAVKGLGDRLVSGESPAEEWRLSDGLQPERTSTGRETLSEQQAIDVARLAREVEATLGPPQDIEWAIKAGRVWLLQARPITTLGETVEPVPVPVEVPSGFWEREASHAPLPWTPFTRSLFFPFRNEATRLMFAEFGVLLETLEFCEIGGWEYIRLVPLGGKDRPAPPRWLFRILTRIVPPIRKRIKVSVEAVRSERARTYIDRWYDEWHPDLAKRINELNQIDLTSLSDIEVAQHLESAVALLHDGGRVHFLAHGALMVETYGFSQVCQELLGWDDSQSCELLSGTSYRSIEPAAKLAELAGQAVNNPPVRELLADVDGSTFDRIAEFDNDFAAAFEAYRRSHGRRALRYEIGDSTLAEEPTLLLQLISHQIATGFDPQENAEATNQQRATLVQQARDSLADASPEDRHRFEEWLRRAERAYPVREDNEFFTLSSPLALVRYAVLEVAGRMTARGQIDERDDAFFLEFEELKDGFGDGSDQHSTIGLRKGERAWVDAHPGPASYGEPPGPPPSFDVLPPEARYVNEGTLWYVEHSLGQPMIQDDSGTIHGHAASPGQYTGTVRVIAGETEFSKIRPGDVVVCPITSPVWSVVFPSIGALVTDTGGILSHPAIIAREYRIPAVVGTNNATELLHDGQAVTVDGSAGTVRVAA
jgi:pyruvate,water dikinase